MTLNPEIERTEQPLTQPAADHGSFAHSAPAPASAAKVTVSWVGVLMALGAIITVVGTFLPFEKIIVFINGSTAGTSTFNGLGSETVAGDPHLTGLKAGNAGMIILVMGVLVLVAAALVLAKKGRLWVGILSLIFSAVAVVMCLASLAAPKSDAKDLNAAAPSGFLVHVLGKIGVEVTLVGAAVALIAAVLALAARRPKAA
jgi:hypothetical protein